MEASEMPVYRTRPLPRGELKGRFLLPNAVVDETRKALVNYALVGLRDGGHEGLVFWAGLQNGLLTVFTTVVIPNAEHSAQGVFVAERAYGKAVSTARESGVVLLAQIHSHPGSDARHSDGDDELIVMPFEGMLSIVVPNYGMRWKHLTEASVHQFQHSQWTLCSEASVKRAITVAPLTVDAR